MKTNPLGFYGSLRARYDEVTVGEKEEGKRKKERTAQRHAPDRERTL